MSRILTSHNKSQILSPGETTNESFFKLKLLIYRMSVSTSQLSIELNDDVEDNEDKNDSSKKKTKKRKMFQSASQLFSR